MRTWILTGALFSWFFVSACTNLSGTPHSGDSSAHLVTTSDQADSSSQRGISAKVQNLSSRVEESVISRIVFRSPSGKEKASLDVETVSKPEDLSRGLMFRKSMDENHGMLFLMSQKKILSFWMKNTYLPLSIAYVNDDMKITDIIKMRPLNDNIHYVSSEPCRYAIEVNQGWFRKNKIRRQDRVEFLFSSP